MLLLPIVGTLLADCHEHEHGGPQSDEYIVNCETADGGVAASDEDFQAIVNAESAGQVMTSPAASLPVLTSPAAGSTLSAASPPTFAFTATAVASNVVVPVPSRESRWSDVVRAVTSELTLERRAYAHCAPAVGDRYLLRVATSSGDAVYTATLSVMSFQPDAAKWSAALAGRQGQTLTIALLRASFANGSITDGPYAATPAATFVVGP